MTRKQQAPPPPHGTGKFGEAASVIYLVTHLGDTLMYGGFALAFKVLGKFWRLWATLAVAGVLGLMAGTWVVAGLVVVGVYMFRVWRWNRHRASPRPGSTWWDEDTLTNAMVAAKILTAPTKVETDKKGRPVPVRMLSRRGQPVHSDRGTSVVVGMPQAATLTKVLKCREELASGLGIPLAQLEVSQDGKDPANVVRIFVSSGTPTAVRPAAVATAAVTDWSQLIVLGPDERGREVTYATTQTHTVLAGATGSGKTDAAHHIAAYAALDVRVRIFGIDGKGDAGPRGWQPLEPCCEAFVRGMGPGSPARVEALLTEVYDLAERRGAGGDEAPEVLLILEEWATARAVLRRLDRAAADRCDALVTVLLATARSRGVHVLLIVQRGTDTSFPVDQRANCGQRLVGKFGDRAEARYVLESLPARLPERAGEFSLSLDGQPSALVTVDHLDNAAWVAVCQRASSLRAVAAEIHQPRLLELVTDTTEIPAVPPADADSLIGAVVTVLEDADPKGLTPATLHGLLPAWIQARYPTAVELGRALARYPQHVERRPRGSARVWRLTAAGGPDSSERVV